MHIKEEHELSDVSFKTWLLPTEVYSMKGDTVQILVPDIHFLGYMQKKYGFLITVAIAEITGIECSVDFITREQIKERRQKFLIISFSPAFRRGSAGDPERQLKSPVHLRHLRRGRQQ